MAELDGPDIDLTVLATRLRRALQPLFVDRDEVSFVAAELDRIARPAVARTDGHPPAADPRAILPHDWARREVLFLAREVVQYRGSQLEGAKLDQLAEAITTLDEKVAEYRAAPLSAAPADDTVAPDMPAIVASVERRYVEALNAILAAPGGSDDVDRWRGQAEAYRTVAEQLRRDDGMPRVEYGSGEWRRTHGVQPVRGSQPEATDG